MRGTGRRAQALSDLLALAGVDPTPPRLRRPGREAVRAAGLEAQVEAVYRSLGGVADEPRVAPGKWDLGADGTPVELDEELHFNRYRLTTLESLCYRSLVGFDRRAYERWSSEREPECLAASWGGRWTNQSAEREFGPAAPKGELDAAGGAPRWKQRAFYDFVKDLTPLCSDHAVARVSIYDRLAAGGERLEARVVLDRFSAARLEPSAGWPEAVVAWVARRAFTTRAPRRQAPPR